MAATSDAAGNRFASLSDEDLQHLITNRLSNRSKNSIKTAVNLFSEYTRSRNSSLADIEQLSVSDLDQFLSRYFAEMRKRDGSLYSRNSVLASRYGLQQHFKKVRGFDIICDKEFKSLHEMFSAVLVHLKSEGKGIVQHKQSLSAQDFTKLYSSSVLNTDTPDGLQNKVFVDIMVHLCNRGQENLREMKPSDFTTVSDTSGSRYVRMRDFLTKNHRGDAAEGPSQQGRMYENPGYTQCPVMAYEKYVSLLNRDCTAFWQKPNPRFDSNQTYWYCNAPLGQNTPTNKMKVLSIAAGLATVYTNHCLSATCISTLDLRHVRSCRSLANDQNLHLGATVTTSQNRHVNR